MGRRRLVAGVAIVGGVAVLWAGTAQLSQEVQEADHAALSSPLFVTWSRTILNPLLAVPAAAGCGRRRDGALLPAGASVVALRTLGLYAGWLAANWAYLRALTLAPASVVAALFSVNSAMVAAASFLLLDRPLPLPGRVAVLCSVAGAVLVAAPWRDTPYVPPGCVALCLAAAAAAAAYNVAFKAWFGCDRPSPEAVGVILAAVGGWSLALGTPLLLGVLATGAETVRWAGVPWWPLVASHACSVGFNFLANFGIAVTDPVFISLGVALGLPLNIAGDALLHGTVPTGERVAGISAIAVGFLLLLYSDTTAAGKGAKPEHAEASPAASPRRGRGGSYGALGQRADDAGGEGG